ncbi:hypothetical protein Misp01_67880 [Microtetraspora sp. NBRC 13810]|uniref:hypothetical protein n=1 Tax=Microtetraspora sp. NBRC 13810 TaxID=3030990 RepID=UPI0024A02E0E|nr:hypothetical protein [Microtetraspora sp. NBRC 13810]GLW11660.1 hypothetical protein Misp01_67880 [Microtetraspora sp. NBRC 13810]
MGTRAGDDLIERIRRHSADGDVVGPAANDLLSELFDGYPVESLRMFLHSGDDSLVRTGTWLLSELGPLAAPLMGEVPALLAHPLRQVRFFAVDVVLMNADAHDGPVIAQVVNLSADPDVAVRWKALEFLAAASAGQLSAGVSRLESGQVRELAEWLLRQESEEPSPDDVAARLEAPDPLVRRFAAAAAARLSDEEPDLLAYVAAAQDEEIRLVAQGRLGEPD